METVLFQLEWFLVTNLSRQASLLFKKIKKDFSFILKITDAILVCMINDWSVNSRHGHNTFSNCIRSNKSFIRYVFSKFEIRTRTLGIKIAVSVFNPSLTRWLKSKIVTPRTNLYQWTELLLELVFSWYQWAISDRDQSSRKHKNSNFPWYDLSHPFHCHRFLIVPPNIRYFSVGVLQEQILKTNFYTCTITWHVLSLNLIFSSLVEQLLVTKLCRSS